MSSIPNRLHLGCGLNVVDGWLNVDGSWNAWLANHPLIRKVAKASRLAPRSMFAVEFPRGITTLDVRKRLPWPDASFDAVYASHLLEHLHHEDAKRLLRECLRVLRPGGVARFVVPDLRAISREYLGVAAEISAGAGDGFGAPNLSEHRPELAALAPADRMNIRLMLREPAPVRGSWLYRAYRATSDFHSHKWMYDARSLTRHVAEAGFEGAGEREFNQSAIHGIEKIEMASRVCGGVGICVEGVRPR